jgi:hypothetical protein
MMVAGSGEWLMQSRRAFTSGGMVVVTANGALSRVPAGECRIGGRSTDRRGCTVRWSEGGVERTGSVAAEDLSSYLVGAIVQYA